MKIYCTFILFLLSLNLKLNAQKQDSTSYEKLDREFAYFMYDYLYRIDLDDYDIERDSEKIFSIGVAEAKERLSFLFTYLKELGNKYLSEIDSSANPQEHQYIIEVIQDYYITLVDLKRNFAEGEFLVRNALFESYGIYYEDSLHVRLMEADPEIYDTLYNKDINLYIDKEIFRDWAFPRFGATKSPGEVKPGTVQTSEPSSAEVQPGVEIKNENLTQTTAAVQKLKDAEALKKAYEKELRDTFKGESVVRDFLKKEN